MTKTSDTGKAFKKAGIYALPWFVLSLLLGMVLGAVVFPFIEPTYAAMGFTWLFSGLISTIVVWFVWIKFQIPENYLNKHV